jgi:hypothetical protein
MKKYINQEKLITHLIAHIGQIEGQEAVIRLLYDYFKEIRIDSAYALTSLGFSYESIVYYIEEEAEKIKNAKVEEVK